MLKIDPFSFAAMSGDKLAVGVQWISGNWSPYFEIRNPAGGVVASAYGKLGEGGLVHLHQCGDVHDLGV